MNARNLLLFDLVVKKGSTRMMHCSQKWPTVTPIPCSNRYRKTTTIQAGGALTNEPQRIAIYSGRVRLDTQLSAQPAAQLAERQPGKVCLL